MSENNNDYNSQDSQANDRKFKGTLSSFGIPAGVIAAIMIIFAFFPEETQNQIVDFFDFGQADSIEVVQPEKEEEILVDSLANYLPDDSTVVIDHEYFKLSYSEKDEQAEWVAYELRGSNLRSFAFERRSSFRKDPKVPSESASPNDYTNSGYDRGHLAPAADMAYSNDAMKLSFYMSNVSPQKPGFNRGIWKELEEQTRDWAKGFEHLYVVTGPVLTQRAQKRLKNNVKAPAAFYKILLDLRLPNPKAVAFLMPNESSDKRLTDYMVPIDSIEALTGIDFFPELPDNMERELEESAFIGRWPYDEERYQMRIGLWNKQAAMASLRKSFE
ncbi:MAG: DNA/RNA non-specific endonuclease [Bacteroidia bacterium]|nr:DNA/RNA non-specific endonuclease [Bacteroidia bacterium]